MGETIKNLGQLLTKVLLEAHMGEKGQVLAILVVKDQTLIVDMTTEPAMKEQMLGMDMTTEPVMEEQMVEMT